MVIMGHKAEFCEWEESVATVFTCYFGERILKLGFASFEALSSEQKCFSLQHIFQTETFKCVSVVFFFRSLESERLKVLFCFQAPGEKRLVVYK